MFSARPIAEHFAGFPACNESLDDLREFVRTVLWDTGLERGAVAGLLLAVEESVSNIIRHGCLHAGGRIHLRVRRLRRQVEIVISDNGRPYDVDFSAVPDMQDLVQTERRGGLGLLLIRRVTDQVFCRREGDRNILTLIKYLRAPTPTPQRRSIRRRAGWIGGLAVACATIIGAAWIDSETRHEVRAGFIERWTEFAATAGASAAQQIFNERSDAELDQLAVGLRSAHPELQYLVVLDCPGLIRADSEHPERVHDPYEMPLGPEAAARHYGVYRNVDGTVHHFIHHMTVGPDTVGSVQVGVADAVLADLLAAARARTVTWALLILIAGELLVILLVTGVARPWISLQTILQKARSQGARLEANASAPDEVQEVLNAVGAMTEAVARSEKKMAQREAAHTELKQAEQLQRALLPEQMPRIPGYEIAASYRMARHVGGDYYDFFPLGTDGDRWVLIVADVAGKGFPAALVMTALRTAVRLLAPKCETPTGILTAVDEYLNCYHAGGPFVTLVCGVLDPKSHRLELASAGHMPALHRRGQDGTVTAIKPTGRPLGLGFAIGSVNDAPREARIESLAQGDVLAFYTDGLSESTSPDQREFGVDGLIASLSTATGSASELNQSIMDGCDLFTQGNTAADDMTLLVLRRKAASDKPASSGNGNGRRTLLLHRWLAHDGREAWPSQRAPEVAECLLNAVADDPTRAADQLRGSLVSQLGKEVMARETMPVETFLQELGLENPLVRENFAAWARDLTGKGSSETA